MNEKEKCDVSNPSATHTNALFQFVTCARMQRERKGRPMVVSTLTGAHPLTVTPPHAPYFLLLAPSQWSRQPTEAIFLYQIDHKCEFPRSHRRRGRRSNLSWFIHFAWLVIYSQIILTVLVSLMPISKQSRIQLLPLLVAGASSGLCLQSGFHRDQWERRH